MVVYFHTNRCLSLQRLPSTSQAAIFPSECPAINSVALFVLNTKRRWHRQAYSRISGIITDSIYYDNAFAKCSFITAHLRNNKGLLLNLCEEVEPATGEVDIQEDCHNYLIALKNKCINLHDAFIYVFYILLHVVTSKITSFIELNSPL